MRRLAILGVGALLASACGGRVGPADSAGRSGPGPTPSATLSSAPPAQPPPLLTRSKVDAAIARLDGIARDTMARTGVPGMAVAVVYQDQVLYMKGFGVRKAGTPDAVGPDTVFQLASVSKPPCQGGRCLGAEVHP